MEGSSMQVFSFGEHPIRVRVDSGPWWVAADVCAVLKLNDTRRAVERLDDDERISTPIIDSMGRTQTAWAVNESGLYSLVLGSRKPQAKAFKRWLTHEVLPALRRTGSYSMPGRAAICDVAKLADLGVLTAGEARSMLGLPARHAVAGAEVTRGASRVLAAHRAAPGMTVAAVARVIGSDASRVRRWEQELVSAGMASRSTTSGRSRQFVAN
jgi:prophage antirepressor-like protein